MSSQLLERFWLQFSRQWFDWPKVARTCFIHVWFLGVILIFCVCSSISNFLLSSFFIIVQFESFYLLPITVYCSINWLCTRFPTVLKILYFPVSAKATRWIFWVSNSATLWLVVGNLLVLFIFPGNDSAVSCGFPHRPNLCYQMWFIFKSFGVAAGGRIDISHANPVGFTGRVWAGDFDSSPLFFVSTGFKGYITCPDCRREWFIDLWMAGRSDHADSVRLILSAFPVRFIQCSSCFYVAFLLLLFMLITVFSGGWQAKAAWCNYVPLTPVISPKNMVFFL